MGAKGKFADYLVGTPSAGPDRPTPGAIPDGRPSSPATRRPIPDGLPSPSLFAHAYYVETKAVLTALAEVKGDLGDGQKAFRAALQHLELDTPTGKVHLDQNRQAVADIFLTEVAKQPDGTLVNKVVKVVPQVDQELGVPTDKFMAMGSPSRTNPSCE